MRASRIIDPSLKGTKLNRASDKERERERERENVRIRVRFRGNFEICGAN